MDSDSLILGAVLHTICGKPKRRVSPVLVTLSSRSDSNFERSNISLKENKRDDDDLNFNILDYCVRKNEGQFCGFRQTAHEHMQQSGLTVLIYVVFTLYRIVKRSIAESAPDRASVYTTNAAFEAVSALKQYCSALLLKVERSVSDRFSKRSESSLNTFIGAEISTEPLIVK